MTTTVRIEHKGPDDHDVMIRVIRSGSGALLREERLKPGKARELLVYRGQAIEVHEAADDAQEPG